MHRIYITKSEPWSKSYGLPVIMTCQCRSSIITNVPLWWYTLLIMEEAMYVYVALGAGRGYMGNLCIFHSIFLWTQNCSKAKQKWKTALKEQNLLKIPTLKSRSGEGPETHSSWHKEKRREFIGRIIHSSWGSRIVSRGDFLYLSDGLQRGWFQAPSSPRELQQAFCATYVASWVQLCWLTGICLNSTFPGFLPFHWSHWEPVLTLNSLTLAVCIKSGVKWKSVILFFRQDGISERSQRAGQYLGWCQGGSKGLSGGRETGQVRAPSLRWEAFKVWIWGFSGWPSGKESACECRRHGFDPESGKISRASEQLSPSTTTTEFVF